MNDGDKCFHAKFLTVKGLRTLTGRAGKHKRRLVGVTQRIILVLLMVAGAGAPTFAKDATNQKNAKKKPKATPTPTAAPEPTTGIQVSEKPSLKTLVQRWGDGTEITELFKSPEVPDAKKLEKAAAKRGKILEEFLASAAASKSFARSEIEEEATLNGVLQMLQLSILRARVHCAKGEIEAARAELGTWLLFAADFPYEEASYMGLKVSGVLRAFVFDELEQIEKTAKDADAPTWIVWMARQRAPWPIDRVVLMESRRLLKPPFQPTGAKLALKLQKNPYQTTDAALKGMPGSSSEEFGFVRELWTDKDVHLMKTEVARLHRLRLRWGLRGFRARSGKAATIVTEAAREAGFGQDPVNYLTGKPWELAAITADVLPSEAEPQKPSTEPEKP